MQEALNNVAKHARASKVEISLQLKDDFVEISVIDNGIGMQNNLGKNGRQLGLLGMRERAYATGGSSELQAADGGGVALRVRLSLVKPMEMST